MLPVRDREIKQLPQAEHDKLGLLSCHPAVLQLSQRRYPLFLGLAITVILVLHLVRLSDLPAGLYLDEGSVGINAIGIAQAGVDEFGTPWPIYFRAFSEYKNPIYIYLTALIFKISGISEHNLRLPSFLFYAGGLAFSLLLIAKLFGRRRPLEVYALVTLGVLPMYFLISRIAFEVISQFTWVAATNVCLWQTFEAPSDKPKRRLFWALASGLLMGTSIYTYTTARLLSLLMLLTVWGVYWGKSRLKLLLAITVTFGISLLPYVYFVVSNPGAITSRFRIVSYLYWDISLLEKVRLFVTHYLTYISPRFLINVGDPNWRHTTSIGGIVFATTLFLFIIGLIAMLQKGRRIDRFSLFLILNLVFSPVAGSLTFESIPQSLRVHLLAYYMVIISCFGLQCLLSISDLQLRRLLSLGVAVLLAYEIIGYQIDFLVPIQRVAFGRWKASRFSKRSSTALTKILSVSYSLMHRATPTQILSFIERCCVMTRLSRLRCQKIPPSIQATVLPILGGVKPCSMSVHPTHSRSSCRGIRPIGSRTY
ncbi:MAG: hypothetical protein HC926_06255 [Synechococcaceae cyanobacterium SM2_3_60]|nr:hypothetical protein [Synechococcaceae cyanobacterium SM2_3_60]